jgi:hypothetical protein
MFIFMEINVFCMRRERDGKCSENHTFLRLNYGWVFVTVFTAQATELLTLLPGEGIGVYEMPSLLRIVRLSYRKLECGHIWTVLRSLYVKEPL